ncbi:hypothetical protein B1778_00790 [Dehalococcoides mccartyi]|uniref:hypothetical protein n=1 Tax=Dehalococcoides mccartyi TaxID=61435 RepID=UPI00098EE7A4|nr:hypothetical protein [Dehalococcoides mccartyi]AQU05309.1 hypothetical protein B1777_00935 [Dehalococcoides mccartyi]AQU06762.1 hypothetical protein B1778_00790 [Dehalococcoides mccartyi]
MDGSEFITSIVALGGVPLILGLVQLFKPFIKDTRYYPLIAVGFGLVINLIAGWALGTSAPSDWITALFNGIIAGLAAGGLYSAGSTLKEGPAGDKENPLHEGERHETD